MKKLLFGLLTTVCIGANAQKIDDIAALYSEKKYQKGKEAVEKFLANPKNSKNTEIFYYKSIILNELSKDASANCSDCREQAFEAYKQYYTLDKKKTFATLYQNVTIFDLYNNYFDAAAKSFNDKKFEDSYKNFANAMKVQKFAFDNDMEYNGFKFSKLDTSLVLNTAIAAVNAKMDDKAAENYSILADAELKREDDLPIYLFLADYYKKVDKAKREKYLALGERLFPDKDVWIEERTADALENTANKDEYFAKYKALCEKFPNNYPTNYNYCAELYNYMNGSESKPEYKTKYNDVLLNKLNSVIKTFPDKEDATLLLARIYYNDSYDLSEESRKLKKPDPATQKKKKELADLSNKKMEQSLVLAEEIIKKLNDIKTPTKKQKNNLKQAAEIAYQVYSVKQNAAKSKEYKALYDSL